MRMTEKLKQLGWLKPGNVEKTIEAVEESKFQIEKDDHNLSIEEEYFMNLFKEKFPRVISNISLLGREICGIDEGTWSFEELKSPNIYYPGIKNWKGKSHFGINFHPLKNWKNDYMQFSFGKNSMELEDIAIKGDEISKPLSSFKAKTENEFCEKYFQLIKENLIRNSHEYRHIAPVDLIHLLNLVPSYIERMYRGMKQLSGEKLEKLQSETNSLENLDVSDFVY